MHSGIIKANISDHFPTFTILENSCRRNKNYEKTKITKPDFSNENIQNFQFLLEKIKWNQIFFLQMHLMKPTIFFKKYFLIYTMSLFQKKEIEIKSKYLNTPWITKEIRKEKENEKTYKTYKNLFERIKKNAKKNY